MINVTKTYLPDMEAYTRIIGEIWKRAWITNNGPVVQDLEKRLKEFLGVDHLLYCNNGTIAIQIAIKALELKGEIITTPFSYVATTNSILWEGCTPVFADIREDDFNIDARKIEEKITPKTSAILAVHVYGNPCDVDAIEAIAKKHNLKVIYDAAHAFGATYKGRSLLSYGDISTCSFHATKIFHTVEGGAVIANTEALGRKNRLMHQFGHVADDYYMVGINGKSSEMHAAMGLCVLPDVGKIIARRKVLSELYDSLLDRSRISRPYSVLGGVYNYAYYPVVFRSEEILQNVRAALLKMEVSTRRYFYPSLNRLPFVKADACPVSERISACVLSLPLYYDLDEKDVERICTQINALA